MSSADQGGPGDRKDEPKGLRKFMRRASLVLRPKSKRQSVSGSSAFSPKDSGAATTGATSGSTAVTSRSATETLPTKADPSPTPSVPAQNTQTIKENKPTPTPIKPRVAMTAKEASALQEEKARVMFAKYGLTLEPGEWATPSPGNVPRIEKQVRMRVRRTCHRCQITFGHDKLCVNCGHTRCKKCPRSPGTKPKAAKGKGAEALTMSDRASGKEMTRKLPTQRVRRTCHECQTLFVGKAVQCENCKHLRCPKCPRDPPKRDKYPEGYPGDTLEGSPTGERVKVPKRTKVLWNCEKCATTFKDREKTCANCGHEKCDSCPRTSPAKTQKPEEEAAIQSVEQRMRNLDVSPQASAA